MKICIDDGSTNIKLAWTENGERRNAISPNSFKSEWSAPFGGMQPANYMLDGVRYGFDPVSDRFVQTTDTQYQYSDVNVIAIHHALVKSGITPQEVDVVVTLPLSEYFETNAQPDIPTSTAKKRTLCARWSTRTAKHSLSVTCGLCLNPFRLALKHWLT
ncbi:stbA family protein [Escherichia coli]|nr:stbA family protein [Escherichia coli]